MLTVEEKCKEICLNYYTEGALKKKAVDWNFEEYSPNLEYAWQEVRKKAMKDSIRTYMWPTLLDKLQIALTPYFLAINPYQRFCQQLNRDELMKRYGRIDYENGKPKEVKPIISTRLNDDFKRFTELEKRRKNSLEVFGIELIPEYQDLYIRLLTEFRKPKLKAGNFFLVKKED